MKIDLQVYSGKDLNNEYIYWHIRCDAEGVPSDEPRMKETMQMLWDRLAADKKGYARIAPRLETQRDFDSDGPVLRGIFRLTTTKDVGELVEPAPDPYELINVGFNLDATNINGEKK